MTFGTFHVGVIDLVIVIVGLLFAIGGFKNGFFKEVVGIGAFVGALVLAYLLAGMVEAALINTPVYPFLFSNLRGLFSGNAVYDVVIDSSQAGALEYLTDGLTQIGLPGFLASPLASLLITFNGTVGDALATAASYFVILIGSYVLTFLVGWILILILGKQLVKLTDNVKLFKFFDAILGAGLGLVRAALVVGIMFLIAVPVSFVVPEVNEYINQDLALATDTFSIGRFLYESILGVIGTFLPS